MKHWKRWLAAVACTAMAAATVAQEAKPLARLAGGEVISAQDLSDYLDRRADLRSVARNAWGVEEVVREMALTRVLSLEGDRLKMQRPSRDVPLRFDDVYGLAVLKKQAPECKRPANEKEAREYFDAHPQAFLMPAQARVQRAMLPVATQVDGKPAMGWLLEQAQAIAAGARKFPDVASRAQEAYALEPQGDLGWIGLQGEGEIVDLLRKIKPGEVMGPLRDGEFAYLFLLVDRREPRQFTWEQAQPFAADQAEAHCRTSGQTQVRDELFKKYEVKFDRDAIRALFQKTGGAPKQ